ncbi:MAG: hypothetical protein HWN81_19790, partial [Candidatus Lokiarchaeota archaeon]|nr:hypothetical protein [Candidatus Lokiarchaeota archaeon]
HVVWEDDTDGVWGNDTEIMYTTYTEATGWLNATVISDGYDGLYWNNGFSTNPNIAVDDLGRINVVWEDETDGIWSYEGWDDLYGVWWLDDTEIMYVNYLEAKGWSNATFISDGYNVSYWNDASSASPNIAVDNLGGIHVVWSNRGSTMYVRISNPPRPSANIPFGESYLIFVIIGIIVLIVYVKRKL